MNASPIHFNPASTTEPSELIIHPDTLATGLLILGGALHLCFLPQDFHDVPFTAMLLGVYVFSYFVCALDIQLHSRIFGWFGGALVCAVSLLAHLFSYIFGSPFNLHASLPQFGLFSIIVQSLFLLLFVREIALADEED